MWDAGRGVSQEGRVGRVFGVCLPMNWLRQFPRVGDQTPRDEYQHLRLSPVRRAQRCWYTCCGLRGTWFALRAVWVCPSRPRGCPRKETSPGDIWPEVFANRPEGNPGVGWWKVRWRCNARWIEACRTERGDSGVRLYRQKAPELVLPAPITLKKKRITISPPSNRWGFSLGGDWDQGSHSWSQIILGL